MPRKRSGPWCGFGTLDGNHHGPSIDGRGTTLKNTFLICTLDNGMMPPPRYSWGKRLWLYGPSGACCRIDIGWYSRKRYAQSDANATALGKMYVEQQKAEGAWPPKRGEGIDVLTAMMHANGLGFKAIKRDDK